MKRSYYLAATIALTITLVFASCNTNDESQGDTAVRFVGGIDKAETVDGSRAAGTTWTNGDAIGIFMVNNGTTTIAESAENKQYTTSGNGTFTAVAGNEIYYPMAGSPVDFIVYYPYKTGTTLTTPANVEIATTQIAANQPGFDLLYSANATGYSKTSTGAVALTFRHKLSKIVMNIVQPSTLSPNDTGLTDAELSGMTVKINGMNTKNTFDFTTGTLGSPNTPAPITSRMITDGRAYDAIILPGNYSAGEVKVDFTISGETFTWEAGAVAFNGGDEYIYDVTLTRTGVNVTGTIIPWTSHTEGGVTAQ